MPETSNVNVLIIDDSLHDREEWRALLSSVSDKKYTFIEAETGEDGLSCLKTSKPECILLDYNLPDMTGVDFIGESSDILGEEAQIPVVMLTGQGNELIAAEPLKQGALDYLIKDKLTGATLHGSISNAIEKVKLRKQLSEKQQELQRFAFTVAHDLKSPLNRVSTYCSLLEKANPDGLSEKSYEYMGIMRNDIKFLIKLIDDLLEYAKKHISIS